MNLEHRGPVADPYRGSMIETRTTATAGSHPVSPELALVDPQARAAERARLPEPDTFARLAATPLESRSLSSFAEQPIARRLPSPKPVALVAVAVMLAATLLLADVRVQVGKTGAAAERSTGSTPTAPRTESQDRRERSARPPAALAAPRRFAWAPTDHASGYRFELFRADKRVFAADTAQPELTLPASWTIHGARETLSPGEYRWYVWPVVDGSRASEAIVQAKLAVRSH
jgi:hypothetical protein